MFDLVAQSIISGVGVGAIYGLIGIGFCVIYNASGIVNFAQGAFVMLGGMITQGAMVRLGLPLPIAAILAIALVAAGGVLLVVCFSPRRRRGRRCGPVRSIAMRRHFRAFRCHACLPLLLRSVPRSARWPGS